MSTRVEGYVSLGALIQQLEELKEELGSHTPVAIKDLDKFTSSIKVEICKTGPQHDYLFRLCRIPGTTKFLWGRGSNIAHTFVSLSPDSPCLGDEVKDDLY